MGARAIAAAAAAAFWGAAAWAAETGDQGGEAGGLPQFQFENWAGHIFWLLIIFGALYLILSRSILPNLATVIEDRRDKIADDLDEAARLRREAETAQSALEQALADARARAQSMADDTKRRIQDELAGEAQAFEAEAAKRQDEAEARIAALTKEALGQAETVASEAAAAVVSSLSGADIDAGRASAAVAAANRGN